ncbi:phosphotransferase system HPr (HPr) family protein [Rivularia sp. PCC 7116]|uniref:phosphoenolpyruvate--protein phosphotransferase n=1 Tax=Rivularia sp. PCC 7116 TaxID=373994 RepID=UPI00029ECDA8|nr:phosphoenolpyruvate--protein phosphotransferase [Rivularia sp. PCC 7116]AFY58457.1 phosphotransferase system HPr (HPr) family protein [Rivularia sp. PCC 7116]
MVGIVIVSHSKQLALGVKELAEQMVQGQVTIAVAAGIDDAENPIGTDTMQVYEAIESVYSDDGVLVLMDLGSALMSAEMALEFLSPEQRDNVYLCEAPLVEGAIAATVTAASGADIQAVLTQAREALTAKASQLGIGLMGTIQSQFAQTPSSETAENTKQIQLHISNSLGIHARPAAKFVSTASKFKSQIQVKNITKNSDFIRGDSINQVITLGVRQGDEIIIRASGVDADDVLAELTALVENQFGEGDNNQDSISKTVSINDSVSASADGYLQGIPASGGFAIATCLQLNQLNKTSFISVQSHRVEDVNSEWRKLQNAVQVAKQEIKNLQQQTLVQISETEAAIFDTHILFLNDPVIIESVRQRIIVEHQNCEFAWQAVIDEVIDNYQKLEDAFLKERVNDVVDIKQRVLRILSGNSTTNVQNLAENLDIKEPVILIANDITPSDTAQLNPSKVLGICITSGSATSHSAILARSLNIPAVVGMPSEILQIANGTLLGVDGEAGKIWIKPDAQTQSELKTKQEKYQVSQQQNLVITHHTATSIDGINIGVLANISSIQDAQTALDMGAVGVGLFRTEFLYFNRQNLPTVEEQTSVYQQVTNIFQNRSVIIRTLDIGGDKPLPYLNLPSENNPFLGWRGIRYCLDNPEILKTQLKAILTASEKGKIKIMFPMITTVAEIKAAKTILNQAKTELNQNGIPFNQKIEVGIMIETPSSVAIADKLAVEVDFFSIGTNDLSQYVMAGDRTNPKVANLVDAMHPSVLRMIHQTVKIAHQHNIWVGLCGELASEIIAAPILLGLGLDEVSLNPQKIPEFKKAIAQLTLKEAEAITNEVIQLDEAVEVRERLGKG